MKVRKIWAALVPATVLSLTLAACGGSSDNNSGNGGGGQQNGGGQTPAQGVNDINATPLDQVKDGGTLRIPLTQIPTNYNLNELDGALADGATVMGALLPGAFYTDAAGVPYVNKDLLDSATLTSTDPKQVVTYKINAKAKWSDGTPITAADFVSNWKALNGKDKRYKIASANGYSQMSEVKQGATPADVIVTFATKYADWKSLFNPVYPASSYNDPNSFNSGWTDHPITTAGPFKWDKIDKTAKTITVVRDPNWWGTKAKLDSLVFPAIASDAQIDALANKEIDVIDIGPNVANYTRAKGIQGVTVHSSNGNNWRHTTYNGQSAVLKDKNVRQAIAMGVDRNRIAAALLGPLGVKAEKLDNHIFMPGQAGYQDNSGVVAYNPDKAKSMLDAAGWKLDSGATYRKKNGQELDLNFVIPSQVTASEQEAKQEQAMLKDIGAKVNIQTVPSDDFFDKYITPGRFDMTDFSWIGTAFPISSSKSIFANPKGDDIQQNFSRVGSPQIDQLFDQATAELDEAKARTLANDADKLIWDLVLSTPLYARPVLVATVSNLANYGAFGLASTIYEKIGFKA